MPRSRIAWLLALGTILSLSLPQAALSQGNKGAAKPTGAQPKRADTGPPPQPYEEDPRFAEQRFSSSVLELNGMHLDQLLSALLAEQEYRDSVALVYARLFTPEAQAECRAGVLASAQAQELARADTSTAERARKVEAKRQALVEEECGRDHWQRSRQAELRRAPVEAARGARLGTEQYSIMKVRSMAFCSSGSRPTLGPRGSLYVYSETEVATVPSRCADLVALIKPMREADQHR